MAMRGDFKEKYFLLGRVKKSNDAPIQIIHANATPKDLAFER
jgi:hypothetical protein